MPRADSIPVKDQGNRKNVLTGLIQSLLGPSWAGRRKLVQICDLPPDLRRDIGFEPDVRARLSFEDKWHQEIDRLRR